MQTITMISQKKYSHSYYQFLTQSAQLQSLNFLFNLESPTPSFGTAYKLITIPSLSYSMGQANKQLPKQYQETKYLQPIDQYRGLYLNTQNNKVYLKNNVIIGTIADIQYEQDIYMFRRVNDQYVVSVDYCSTNQDKQMCSSYSLLSYFVEKPEYTLFQIYQSSFQDGITLLRSVMKGFEILYQKFGYFTPTSKLIFFNKQNYPKVWINEDLKITKNIQNPHGPKNLTFQNTFIRQVIRLFDGVRDPTQPMLRYSQFLPNQLLRFNSLDRIFFGSISSFLNQNKSHLGNQLNLIKKSINYPSSPVKLLKKDKFPLSPQFSSPFSPSKKSTVSQQPPIHYNFSSSSYNPSSKQINSIKKTDLIKEPVKLSMRNTPKNPYRTNFPAGSQGFASTMPNSLRNSKMSQNMIKIQNTPSNKQAIDNENSSCKNQQNDLNAISSKRYSEAIPTIFQEGVKFHLGNRTTINQPLIQYSKSESFQSFANSPYDKTNNADNAQSQKLMQKLPFKKCHFNPTLNDKSSPRDFQCHKRHQTDVIHLDKTRNSNDFGMNQFSLDASLNHFHLKTIKSINVQDGDREFDKEIVSDLKNIIKKYRQRQ